MQAEQTHRAKKSLGQHFLCDQHAIRTIVRTVPEGESLIEIGPGRGAITKALLPRAQILTLIEMDDALATHWQQQSDTDTNLRVIHGDVMREIDAAVAQQRPTWIVGNLPYNISGPLTAKLASFALAGGMVLMYQREVADRIAAAPGSKVYGGLSVLVRHYYDVKKILTLPPRAFSPPPKVHSAVVQLTPHHRPPGCDYHDLQQSVRQGFAHRRKTIYNNFRGVLTQAQLQSIDIDPRQRPEQLDYAAWVRLTCLRRNGSESIR